MDHSLQPLPPPVYRVKRLQKMRIETLSKKRRSRGRGGACGLFVSGDPGHQLQTWNFSKEEIKDPSRNEGCEKVGFEPGTSGSVAQRSNH